MFVDMDDPENSHSIVNPDLLSGLVQALSRAQAKLEAVGKDGLNDHGGYRYATHDAIIRACREALSAEGLAFLSSWSADQNEEPGNGKQWQWGMVRISWLLLHGGGGGITGSASVPVIAGGRTPPDKAVAAAVSFGLGYVLRGILLLDKAGEKDLSPDARGPDEYSPPPRPAPKTRAAARRTPAPPSPASKALVAAWDQYRKCCSAIGVQPIARAKIFGDALGHDWPEQPNDEQRSRATAHIHALIAAMQPSATATAGLQAAYAEYVEACQTLDHRPRPLSEIGAESIQDEWPEAPNAEQAVLAADYIRVITREILEDDDADVDGDASQ